MNIEQVFEAWRKNPTQTQQFICEWRNLTERGIKLRPGSEAWQRVSKRRDYYAGLLARMAGIHISEVDKIIVLYKLGK